MQAGALGAMAAHPAHNTTSEGGSQTMSNASNNMWIDKSVGSTVNVRVLAYSALLTALSVLRRCCIRFPFADFWRA